MTSVEPVRGRGTLSASTGCLQLKKVGELCRPCVNDSMRFGQGILAPVIRGDGSELGMMSEGSDSFTSPRLTKNDLAGRSSQTAPTNRYQGRRSLAAGAGRAAVNGPFIRFCIAVLRAVMSPSISVVAVLAAGKTR